ncbi:arylesterase [Aliikangiella maris]|uniref:Arylesterase n=2 Tax=Aliikangiella maris TaxID=3162458 RepID=A0ABV3MUE5_9GAMM
MPIISAQYSTTKAIVLKSLLFFLIYGLLAGCTPSPSLPKLTDHSTIIAFGDSLTVGVGTSRENSYPQVLEALTGLSVINAGISGETTTGGLKRFQQVLNQYQPTIVILMEGGNDILQNHPREQTQQNLAKMIEIAQDNQIAIVLIGVPEKKLFSQSAPLYQELAEKYELVFEPEILSQLLRNPNMKSDPVHLNREGYSQLANRIFERLKNHGALTD